MDQKIRKLMTMYIREMTLTDSLGKDGGRGLTRIEDCVDVSILKECIKKSQEKTNYSGQYQPWQHKNKQKNNN